MIIAIEKNKKIEFGDFQTPKELADEVCQKLVEIGISPKYVIEPTCGLGTFLESATQTLVNVEKFIGVEVNPEYYSELSIRSKTFPLSERIEIKEGDFFKFGWNTLLKELKGEILVLGNFPWVTNAVQGTIGGVNLPQKTNFQNHRGYDALTGKSNFDISEFMLIKVAEWFQYHPGHLAMLVKTSVARKFLGHADCRSSNCRSCPKVGLRCRPGFARPLPQPSQQCGQQCRSLLKPVSMCAVELHQVSSSWHLWKRL